MIDLYPHQVDLIGKTRAAMSETRNVCMVSPTGSGKTVMGADILHRVWQKGKRAWFVAPRRQLVRQTSLTLEQFSIPHSFICAGWAHDPAAPVHVCTTQSLMHALGSVDPADLIILDEAHYGAGMVDTIVARARAADKFVLGLTATPCKADGSGLGKWFGQLTQGVSVSELMEMGFLSRYKAFAPGVPDLSGVAVRAGDYAVGALSGAMIDLQGAIVANAHRHWLAHAQGMRTVIFCVDVAHSKATAGMMTEAGIRTAHMDGETPDDERMRIINMLADGELDAISNCGLMTFGFDLSAQIGRDVPLECMIDLRPTKSLPLQRQKEGRVLRRKPTPALIFDCAGNLMEHGFPDDPQEWTLEGKIKKSDQREEDNARQCERCDHVHHPAPVCPECGYVYPVKPRKAKQEVSTDMREIKREEMERARAAAKAEQSQARTFEDLVRLGRARGYKSPQFWARKVMEGRGR